MKVKIVKCSDPQYWYSGMIGRVFDVDEKAWTFNNKGMHTVSEDKEKFSKRTIDSRDFEAYTEAEEDRPLSSYELETIMKWRDSAVSRIKDRNAANDVAKYWVKSRDRDNFRDEKWLIKLNRLIAKKVFDGKRAKDVLPKYEGLKEKAEAINVDDLKAGFYLVTVKPQPEMPERWSPKMMDTIGKTFLVYVSGDGKIISQEAHHNYSCGWFYTKDDLVFNKYLGENKNAS